MTCCLLLKTHISLSNNGNLILSAICKNSTICPKKKGRRIIPHPHSVGRAASEDLGSCPPCHPLCNPFMQFFMQPFMQPSVLPYYCLVRTAEAKSNDLKHWSLILNPHDLAEIVALHPALGCWVIGFQFLRFGIVSCPPAVYEELSFSNFLEIFLERMYIISK